jgi:phosphocarrier protein HPr
VTERATAELVIRNELGLHARSATALVTLAARYEAALWLSNDEREVNGKSIMGVLLLMAGKGTRITARAEGPDARELIDALTALVDNKFGERR